MTTFTFDEKDKDRIFNALNCAANLIETGDASVSAETAENLRDHERERRYGRPMGPQARALSTEAMREVVALRDLANRIIAEDMPRSHLREGWLEMDNSFIVPKGHDSSEES